jgi:hypothetical protein
MQSGTLGRHTDTELHLKIPKLVWTLFLAVRVGTHFTCLLFLLALLGQN